MKYILHIFFDQFRRGAKIHYGVTVLDAEGYIEERYNLDRKPRKAIFDEVRECGCGESSVQHLEWCTRQKRVFRHPLIRLALGYRERHPSRSGDLHFVGQHFPTYMADVLAGTGYEWLAELAALEWACETALVEAREQPLRVDALAGLGPEDLANVRLRLQPSLRCVASSVPVLDVWRANQPHADGAAVTCGQAHSAFS